MLPEDKYNVIFIGKYIDFTGEPPNFNKTVLTQITEPGLSFSEIKAKYWGGVKNFYETVGDPNISQAVVYKENDKWVVFDIAKNPHIKTWDDLRDATGKLDL
jgi:hypothetical protein